MASDIDKDKCEVCSDQMAVTLNSGGFDGVHQNCPRCGEFKLSGTACSLLRQPQQGKDKRAKLSGWVRTQNRMGSVPTITTENLQKILASPIPSIGERADALLLEAEFGLKGLGERFNVTEPRFLAATYSESQQDVVYLMRMLKDQGLAAIQEMSGGSEILPGGYIRINQISRTSAASTKGFVAMSFQEDLQDAYSNGFQVGIIGAGYDPLRMDRLEHINRIDDEIIKQINSSKFVVADFTAHKGGVYFEAGYAMGLGLPIFWTCNKEHMKDLHFDIRQFNCIDWQSPHELATRLQTRIEAVLGKGPR